MFCKRAALAFVILVVIETALTNNNDTTTSLDNTEEVTSDDSLGDEPLETTITHETPKHEKVINLTIFYEALDRHSINFFKNQLRPVFLKLHQHLAANLIPYGRAKLDGRGGIICEHGRNECALNKVMACGLQMLQYDEDKVVYATCVLEHGVDILKEPSNCAKRVRLTWGRVHKCAVGNQGDKALQEMGSLTPDSVYSSQLPMIEIDGSYNAGDEIAMLHNFEKFVCGRLDNPPECDNMLVGAANDDEEDNSSSQEISNESAVPSSE